jgi:hypothetical protein
LHIRLDGFNALLLAHREKGRRRNNAHLLGHIDHHKPDIELGQRFRCGRLRESIHERDGKRARAPDDLSADYALA